MGKKRKKVAREDMIYLLIKKYPGSKKIGTLVHYHAQNFFCCYDTDRRVKFLIKEKLLKDKEFWHRIK
jgi:hypothetical protein